MPSSAENAAADVVRTLRNAGHVAFFAGGCVRDRLLGLEPKDYDVATDAPPDRVRRLFPNTQAVGAAFGVILVRSGGHVTEVATFRSDGQYADGRRPESVTFSSAEADAQRRDFSINGLFQDPFDGRVIDHVGGQADLSARVLRAIGAPAERFAEDHLRLLRAVRFAARFGLSIEPRTAAAIDAAAGLLKRISAERTTDELRRILTAPTRDAGYRLLRRHGLLRAVLPAFDSDIDDRRSLLLRLPRGKVPEFPVAWLAVTLDPILARHGPDGVLRALSARPAAGVVDTFRDVLRPSNHEADAVRDVAAACHAVLIDPTPDDARLKRMLARVVAPQARQLLDAMAACGIAVERIDALRPRLDALAATDVAPPPLLTGDALIAAGGRPGPAFKRVLDAVYDAQLNATITDAAEALALGLDRLRDGGPRRDAGRDAAVDSSADDPARSRPAVRGDRRTRRAHD